MCEYILTTATKPTKDKTEEETDLTVPSAEQVERRFSSKGEKSMSVTRSAKEERTPIQNKDCWPQLDFACNQIISYFIPKVKKQTEDKKNYQNGRKYG